MPERLELVHRALPPDRWSIIADDPTGKHGYVVIEVMRTKPAAEHFLRGVIWAARRSKDRHLRRYAALAEETLRKPTQGAPQR